MTIGQYISKEYNIFASGVLSAIPVYLKNDKKQIRVNLLEASRYFSNLSITKIEYGKGAPIIYTK